MINPAVIFAAVDEADGLDDLKKRLAARNIELQFVKAPGSPEPTGWNLREGGVLGTWLKGSSIDRRLAFKRMIERMRQRRLEREQARIRELLGDLFDDLERYVQENEAVQNGQPLAYQQQSLLGALATLSSKAIRLLVIALANAFAKFLEKIFGLPPGSMGRIHMDEDEVPRADPPAPMNESTRKNNLPLAQLFMAMVLAKTVEAIQNDDTEMLPGAKVLDAAIRMARQNIIDFIDPMESAEEESAINYPKEKM